jgi:hypothetical protein
MDSATHDMAVQRAAGGQPNSNLIRTYTRLWCCCFRRRWPEPVDLRFLLSQTKYNRSLAPAEAHVDSATHDMAVQRAAGGQPNSNLIRTYTRLWCCCFRRRWPEPFDLRLLLSQTKYNRSLAPAEAHVDSATHDMAVQRAAGGQPKSNLIRTYTRLWCCCFRRRWPELVDLRLLLSQTKYNRSLAPDDVDLDSATHIQRPNVPLAVSFNSTFKGRHGFVMTAYMR